MQIPFHKSYITDDEIDEVVDSLKSGWITSGPKTICFEDEFKSFVGAKHAVALNSCTAALHLALKVIGLKEGDEVLLPSMTFTATAEVICYFGAKPVLIDVCNDTMNIDVTKASEYIEKAGGNHLVKAIIPVHFAGQSCDMQEIRDMADCFGLFIIEDAAHAFPAKYGDKMIGNIGDITCFSFYATKTLATGEGGMLTTNNDEWAKRAKTLRLHGISKDVWDRYSDGGSWYYEVVEPGYKYNMTDIQAGLGLAQLRKTTQMLDMRRNIAERYSKAFQNTDFLEPPVLKEGRETAWHLYVLRLQTEKLSVIRNVFIEKLKERGIGVSVHFIPLHKHPYYRDTFGYTPEDLPVTEDLFHRIISLPLFPGMTDVEVKYVIDAVLELGHAYQKV